jgi:hypothetical protein
MADSRLRYGYAVGVSKSSFWEYQPDPFDFGLSMKSDPYGVVYFVGASMSGPVKIGFTTDRTAESRVAQLQTGSHEELVILGTIEAGPTVERAIHSVLSTHSVRGEWFEREPAMALYARMSDNTTSRYGKFARRLMLSADVYLASEQSTEALEFKVASNLIFDIARELASVNTDRPLPFRSWLKSQSERDDPTGDLANDFADSKAFPDVGNLETYLAFIDATGRRAAVTRAVVDAWIECDMSLSSLKYIE